MSYKYEQLDQDRRQIRIFTLLPSPEFESILKGRLRVVDFNSSLKYKALSYVWGTDPPLHPLLEIDGSFCNISAHLANILKHIRQPDTEPDLWIDAVCIDQKNKGERGFQVPMMRDIYRNCSTDLVWLENPLNENKSTVKRGEESSGEDEKSSDDEEKEFRILAQHWTTFQEWRQNMPSVNGEENNLDDEGKSDDYGEEDDSDAHEEEDEFGWQWDGAESSTEPAATIEQGLDFIKSRSKQGITLQDFGGHNVAPSTRAKLEAVFGTRLWSRVWIVQELACAKDVLLLGGRRKLKWSVLSKFLARPYNADRYHSPWGRGIIESGLANIFFQAAEIDMQRAIMRSGLWEESTLFNVLSFFSDRESSDARDKVYGLLGLISPHFRRLTVDYTDENKPAKVFSEATKEIIYHSQNLDVLCQSPWERQGVPQCSRLGHRTEDLPSWAIDFAAPKLFRNVGGSYRSRELMFADRGIFSAGGDFCGNCWQVLDGKVLQLHGYLLGKIGPPQPQPPQEPREFRPDIWGDEITQGIYNATGEPKFQALWRTMVTDCKGYPMERLSRECIKNDDDIFRSLRGEYVEGLSCEAMWWRIKYNWTFYVSEEGLFVMARKHVRTGDYIAIIEGAKVPLILQSVSCDRFEIVSPAYVHGYMDKDSPIRSTVSNKTDLFIV